jgi:hypothetical protein
MASQPPSLHRFRMSQPEIAVPIPPVQPRMTRVQEEEMKGWFLPANWTNIMERVRCWRIWRLFGESCPAATPPPSDALLLDPDDAIQRRGPWGEERDSWLSKAYAPYFGAQWKGVLLGPGPEDPPSAPTDMADEDDETAGEVLS